MKKAIQVLTLTLIFVILFCSFADFAYAKDFEPCYHCNTTGQFHCNNCDNKGYYLCEECKGVGGFVCPDCDSGYLICISCKGDGKNRTGNGDIVDE